MKDAILLASTDQAHPAGLRVQLAMPLVDRDKASWVDLVVKDTLASQASAGGHLEEVGYG